MRRVLRVVRWIGIGIGVLIVGVVIVGLVAHEPRPEGREGPAAEALAASMEAAVDVEAWARTGAVRWDYAGRQEHLWDCERGLARVRWGDVEVLAWAGSTSGRAYRDGHEVRGEDAVELLEDGQRHFINDSFWLNPIAKIRDDGVSLSAVTLEEGGEGLLVTYSSGGLTPGDAYLWILEEDGLPRAWRMWVSIIPVGGVEVSWERWVTLETGARIATRHEGPLGLAFEITDLAAAATLGELEPGADPFAALVE
jgi:hypothetical protein